MALLNNRTQIRWPLWKRFLALACLIVFIPLTIAVLVVIGLIPVYLSNRAIYITRSTVVSPFNVTYLLLDPSNGLNLNSVDRTKMSRSFEHGLGLRMTNILQIRNISPDIAIGTNSGSRRKRFVQCDQDSSGMSGPVLIIDFNFTYPIHSACQTDKCINETYTEVYKQFESVPLLSIDFDNVSRELRLCSMGVLSRKDFESTNSTTISPSIMTISSTSNITTPISSSIMNTLSTGDITTPIENSSQSNYSSNGTIVDFEDCWRKVPMIQEKVPPYRIFHTSTFFFQNNQSLIVAGASKFETIIDMQTIKRPIIIDGIMVYTNCQRTSEISLPMICHPRISS